MRKEVKIGCAGLAALIILFLGINFLKGVSLFRKTDTYFIVFENAKGLTKSSSVYADGYEVGIVSDIIYDFNKPGEVVVEISTQNGLRITKGSIIRLDESMLNGCTLNIKLATDTNEVYLPNDTITGVVPQGLMNKAEDLVPQLQSIITKVDTLLSTLNTLAANQNLPMILENTEALTANLNESTKELNRLLKKDIPQMTSTFNKAGENVVVLTDNLNKINLQVTMDSVNTTISSVHHMMEQIQSPKGTLGLMMSDASLYNNLNNTVQNADSLMIDLKKNPKRYVHFSVFGKSK